MTPSDSSLAVFVVQALGATLVAMALLATAWRYDRVFLKSWTISSAALATFVLSSALSLHLDTGTQGTAHAVSAIVAVASKWAQALWLLIGLHELMDGSSMQARRRTMRTLAAVLAGSAAVVLVSQPLSPGGQYLARFLVPEAAAIAVCVYAAGRLFARVRQTRSIGAGILVVTFAVLALEETRHNVMLVASTVGGIVPIDADWLGFVDLFLGAGLGVGALTLLLEEESARLAATAARAQDALKALSRSERRQRFVLDHIDEVIWSFEADDVSGRLRLASMSGRVRDILGHDPEYLLAHPAELRSLIHPDDVPRIEEAWSHIAATRQPGWYEYRVHHHDEADYRWIEDRVSPQFDPGGRVSGIFGVSRDVTERKRAEASLRRSEEQVRQGQKMEAVGRLAGGIAHDFNNLLTVIAGHNDLLLETLPEDDPRHPDARAIGKAAERATALVRQLLVFSRRQMLHLETLDPGGLVAELETMLARLIGEHIRLSLAIEPGVGWVRADRSQIEQVVVNLVVNARDAMPAGGAIVLEVRDSAARDEPVLERLGVVPGEYVVLAVHDTGAGISPEVRQRLFEPFFTTKEHGKGTGLGLATVYGIVRQCGGDIDVRSEAGRGASFSIYLPRQAAEAQEAPQDAGAGRAVEPRTDAKTILVVEDELAVRNFVVAALHSRGHTTLEAASGDAALDLVARHVGPIDLVLTDVVMPGMRGTELVRQLARERPEIRIVFMTGYTDDATWRAAQSTGHPVLAKPFTSALLLRAVRDGLARPPASLTGDTDEPVPAPVTGRSET